MLFTIGYSPFFEIESFIDTLKKSNINFLIDIRTFSYSKTFPVYDYENLNQTLKKENIKHTFLGDYIGGLTVKKRVREGVSKLEDLLDVQKFREGMNKLFKISKENKVAVMCAEKDPMDCHRFLAVGSLMEKVAKVEVFNIVGENIESFSDTINRWKNENNLELLEYSNEKIILERLILLYKLQNKKEEREIKFPKTKVLFE